MRTSCPSCPGRLRPAPDWLAPAAIGLLALLVRAAHLTVSARLPLADDAVFFEQHARRFLAAWQALGTSRFPALFWEAVDHASLQGVLYPLFQSAVYLLAGGVNHRALATVQALLGAATASLTYLTARRAFGSGAAIFAGLLAAIYPPLVLANGWLLAETLLIFLQALALFLLVRGLERGAWPARLLGGLCVGLLMLRPAFQYAGPLLLAALLIAGWLRTPASGPAGRSREALALAVPYLAGLLVVAIPWVLANGLVFGQYVWSRTGDAWQQVYWGIYPPNRGWWPPDSPVPPKYGVESLPFARASGMQIEVRDLDYLYAAIDQVRATPLKALATEVNKLYQAYLHPSDTYAERPALVGWLAVPLHRALLLLGLAGLCLSWLRPRPALVLAAGLFVSALPFLASHIDVRYTVPPSQVLALFAGLAAGHLVEVFAPPAAAGARRRLGQPAWPAAGVALVAAALLPVAVWWLDVPQLLSIAPQVAPWHAHLVHAAAMSAALLAAGTAAGVALAARAAGSQGRRFIWSGAACGAVLAWIYAIQALYDGDWHQWSVRLAPGEAVRQTIVLPEGWQAPAGGWAEVRIYLAGSPAETYDPVVRVNGQELLRLGPALKDAGPLKFWRKIMEAAWNQRRSRAEVPQWVGVPLDLTFLQSGRVDVEVAVEPVYPDGAAGAAGQGWLQVWGDFEPRPGARVYDGPAVHSRIPGQDEAFLKYIATGEYGIWRWTPLQSERVEAAWRGAPTAPARGAVAWHHDDLSPTTRGRQTGQYRIRVLVYGPNGDLGAVF
jgi:4-amino-4-deoxy-L-arabinose transferase-like glycosyltransferase